MRAIIAREREKSARQRTIEWVTAASLYRVIEKRSFNQ
jgi:hypothetical protein